MKTKLVPGARYAAGLDLPGLIPGINGIAEEKFKSIGFKDARVLDTDQASAELLQRPEAAGKDFDSVATGTYSGPAQEVELPSQVVWFVQLSGPASKVTPASDPRVQVLKDAGYTKTAEVLRNREEATEAPKPPTVVSVQIGGATVPWWVFVVGGFALFLVLKNHHSRSPARA